MLKRKFTITIEGLIGSGKSTLLNNLQTTNINGNAAFESSTIFVPEPIEDFQKCKLLNRSFNPLKEFYSDKHGNGVCFQSWVNKCYEKQLSELCAVSTKDTMILMDRCPYSSVVFLRSLSRLKVFSDFTEYYLENEVATTIKKYFGGDLFGIDKVYFLDTPIDICVQQIVKRGRYAENEIIDLERYLRILESEYKLFVNEFVKERGANHVRFFYHPNQDVVVEDFLKFMNS